MAHTQGREVALATWNALGPVRRWLRASTTRDACCTSAVGPFAETVAGDALAGAVADGSIATWSALALVGAAVSSCALLARWTCEL